MITAQDYYQEIQQNPPLPSGDPVLDRLLEGGFLPNMVHLLIGPRSYTASILMRTAINALRPRVDGGKEFQNVAYVDGQNLFNPYFLSKLAVASQLNPAVVLNQIQVARAFTWNQMVELVEEKLPKMEKIDLLLVAGLTDMFEETTQDGSLQQMGQARGQNQKISGTSGQIGVIQNYKAFQDLQRMITGLKTVSTISHPIIILTGPFHSKSFNRPAGGQIMTHFANILIGIHDQPRYVQFTLDQHPFFSYREAKFFKAPEYQDTGRRSRSMPRDAHSLTLDAFVRPTTKSFYAERK
jgi:hypothetical protein